MSIKRIPKGRLTINRIYTDDGYRYQVSIVHYSQHGELNGSEWHTKEFNDLVRAEDFCDAFKFKELHETLYDRKVYKF